jgi:hypothetical protein
MMSNRRLWLAAILTFSAGLAALGLAQTRAGSPDNLVAHEWGTFLAMSGSDGVSLEGMYHEEHALPSFVHARSCDQLHIPSVILKGETPVIYFYTDEPQDVRVTVRFPKGLWTQWYPQAQVVGPPLSAMGSPGMTRDGRITWCAQLTPAASGPPTPAPPETSADALWNFARQVDAAYVTTPDWTKGNPAPVIGFRGNHFESDRFLFYRGLGAAPLPVQFTAAGGGTLESGSGDHLSVQHVFIIRVDNGKGAYAYRPALKPGEKLTGVIPSMNHAQPLDEFTRTLADDLAARLVESGLYAKEARAMVNTWTTSYFQTDGIRALFLLPQEWTDVFIPLTIEPAPQKIVRVMVGRIELLSPERERLAEAAVHGLTSADRVIRERAFQTLRDQGRYVEPIIRRVLKTSSDEQVRMLCRRLLLTDFVTELRAAIPSAADGRRLMDDPIHMRAQLALLLREIGLTDEAKAEAQFVLGGLDSQPQPSLDRHDARFHLRAYARASEALGDDRSAAAWYDRFITFGSQAATKQDCRGCHRDAGPTDIAWFRGWWAGERYAAVQARLGDRKSALAAQEAAVRDDPSDVAARLKLAYLLEASGDRTRADALWSEMKFLAQTGALGVKTSDLARAGER